MCVVIDGFIKHCAAEAVVPVQLDVRIEMASDLGDLSLKDCIVEPPDGGWPNYSRFRFSHDDQKIGKHVVSSITIADKAITAG
jgi:hypothetical protein